GGRGTSRVTTHIAALSLRIGDNPGVTQLRFVEWNTAWDHRTGFEPKAAALAGLNPDVAVVCEVPSEQPALAGLTAWAPTLRELSKGLAIASFGPSLSDVRIDPLGGQMSIS